MIINSQDLIVQLERLKNKEIVHIQPPLEPYVYINSQARMIDENNVLTKFVTVKNDHNAETIYFRMNRIFNGVDLYTKECVIKYIGIKGLTFCNIIKINESYVEKDTIEFAWKLTNEITYQERKVPFQVMFYSTAENKSGEKKFDYIFNTSVSSLNISHGIDVL